MKSLEFLKTITQNYNSKNKFNISRIISIIRTLNLLILLDSENFKFKK